MLIEQLIDPTTKHTTDPFPRQEQEPPGLTEAMAPLPDHGEQSYRGSGRLMGRRALITGGDSGIGHAVAIAFAREGARVAISYLPSEQRDADETRDWIADAGGDPLLLPGDLRSEQHCMDLVGPHGTGVRRPRPARAERRAPAEPQRHRRAAHR